MEYKITYRVLKNSLLNCQYFTSILSKLTTHIRKIIFELYLLVSLHLSIHNFGNEQEN